MRLSRLWIPSIGAGLAGALFLYDALPGINWTIVTVIAAAALVTYRSPDPQLRRALAIPLGFAVFLSGAFAITDNSALHVLNLLIVASLLALSLLIGREADHAWSYGAVDILTAPLRGLACTLQGAFSSVVQAVQSTRIATIHPVLRGSLVALPVVVLLALLFASADPVFASGRDAVYNVFQTWTTSPRIIFGIAFALFVAGACTASLPVPSTRRRVAIPSTGPDRLTERRTMLGAVAGICWLFVLLQIGYLFFGNPGTVGSGMTFAQYAHQGFGELAVAATITALVIVATHSDTYFPALARGGARSTLTLPSLLLLAAVVCILISAFHRVALYEDAYGFSVLRVYAQAYIVLTLAVFLILAWRVTHEFEVRALARNVMTVSLVAFSALVYWNCDAWVVRANLDRFAITHKLDVSYLARGLSDDGYPALVQALPRMTPDDRASVVAKLNTAVSRERLTASSHWFEWNLRRDRAMDALRSVGIHPG